MVGTDRLILRPLEAADLDAFARMFADPEVVRYVGDGTTATSDEAREWLARRIGQYAADGRGMLAVVRRSDGAVIGRCGLTRWTIDGVVEDEVGYLLDRAVWGFGYATEAARAMRDHAIETHRLTRLIALIDHGNEASVRVAVKLGMAYERDVESHPGKRTRLFSTGRRAGS
jgi:ribosomal-protein-alanine N-acetyltransferase